MFSLVFIDHGGDNDDVGGGDGDHGGCGGDDSDGADLMLVVLICLCLLSS